MTHDEFYALPPAGRIPVPGDEIRVNYGTGLYTGYRVVREYPPDERYDSYSFELVVRSPGAGRKPTHWLHGYTLLGDRLVGRSMGENTASYHSNGGGLDGDGRDEIRIERPATQGWLFRD